MARLWSESRGGGWTSGDLDSGAGRRLDGDVRIVPLPGGRRPRWALLAVPDRPVRVNALPVAGVRLLSDRDEIVLADASRFVLSTAEPARVEPYDGPADAICPRCRSAMVPGAAAVTCPNCGVAHHQDEHRPCYRYAEGCAVRAHPTDDDRPAWTPEEI